MTKKSKPNHESLSSDIWENFFQYDLHTYRLDLFIDAMETIISRHEHQLSFIDTLFLEDNSKISALTNIVQNNGHELFISLLEKFKDEFQSVEPTKWSTVLWFEENKCHNHLLNFYGKDYFEKILDPNHWSFTGFHYDFFKKNYLSGNLDNSFTMNNLKNCHNNISVNMALALNFYDENKDEFKKFISNIITDKRGQDTTNLTFQRFIYLARRGRPSPNNNADSAQIFSLSLPSESEIDLLIEKWGIEKTSKTFSEYLNFQRDCLELIGSNNKLNLDSDLIEQYIQKNIQFHNCGSILASGLRTEPDLLSYFIVIEAITKEDLLSNIRNDTLNKKANYHFLSGTLEDSNISKTRKIKI